MSTRPLSGIDINSMIRLEYDKGNKAIRNLVIPYEESGRSLGAQPLLSKELDNESIKEHVLTILKNNADQFKWNKNLSDIEVESINKATNRISTRFIQW